MLRPHMVGTDSVTQETKMVWKIAFAGIASLSLVSVSLAAEVQLRIMETTDVHMNLLS